MGQDEGRLGAYRSGEHGWGHYQIKIFSADTPTQPYLICRCATMYGHRMACPHGLFEGPCLNCERGDPPNHIVGCVLREKPAAAEAGS